MIENISFSKTITHVTIINLKIDCTVHIKLSGATFFFVVMQLFLSSATLKS